MSGANALRGEAELRVDGRVLVLRPSFAALVAAEAELGPLFALVEDLKRLALSVMNDIARAAISGGINAAMGGGGGSGGGAGGLLSLGTSIAMALFGAPGRATGGPVSAGRAYRVGERGPELFVPTASGRIEAAGGVTRNIAITVNVRGDAGSEPQRLAQTGRQLARAVRRAVAAGED